MINNVNGNVVCCEFYYSKFNKYCFVILLLGIFFFGTNMR